MWYEYACWRYRQRASRHMLKHSYLDGGARERPQQTHVKYSYTDTEVREDELNPLATGGSSIFQLYANYVTRSDPHCLKRTSLQLQTQQILSAAASAATSAASAAAAAAATTTAASAAATTGTAAHLYHKLLSLL